MKKALVIGIDEYPSDPLPNCEHDAREFASVLQMAEYGFAASDVCILLNGDATIPRITAELTALSAATELALIYFAGHGQTTDIGTFLVTPDGTADNEGVEIRRIAKITERRLAHVESVLIMLDCCHAGAATIACRPPGDLFEQRAIETLGSPLGDG